MTEMEPVTKVQGALVTTSSDVRDQFMHTDATRGVYDRWRRDGRYQEVVEVVEQHRTTAIYDLTPEDFQAVCEVSEHALGNVRTSDADISLASDWNPSFAFTHILHYYMEHKRWQDAVRSHDRPGRLDRRPLDKLLPPTWLEFKRFTLQTEPGRHMLGDEVRRRHDEIVRQGYTHERARDALRWRVGNSYYGVMRDIYTIVQLRARGLDVRVHPLADALFRVDAWVDQTVLSIMVSNNRYREANHGRKRRPEDLLRDPGNRFDFLTIALKPAPSFGVFHLPTQLDIDKAAQRIRAQLR